MIIKKYFNILGLLSAVFYLNSVFAQIDPSTAVLLESTGSAPKAQDFDGSRYQVKKRNKDERVLQSNSETKQQPQKAIEQAQRPVEVEPQTASPPAQTIVESEKSMAEKVQKILLGGTFKDIEDYKKLIDPRDYRNNIVDLHLAPIYVYNDSSSNSWFRDYHSGSPGISVGADIWMTPFFGVYTNYQTSFGASIQKSASATGKLPVDHEWFGAGLNFRKFFGVSRRAPGLVIGIGFDEHQMKVSGESTERIGVKSSGVKLSVEALLPRKKFYQWSLGLEFIPRGDHEETETGLSLSSGKNTDNTKLGINLGGKFVFSRKNQMFWKIKHSVERNIYEGTSDTNDPRYGNAISGVEVTNSVTIFSLGYTWGN